MFGAGETVGLAEWIIDDTCLVKLISGSLVSAWASIEAKFQIFNGGKRRKP